MQPMQTTMQTNEQNNETNATTTMQTKATTNGMNLYSLKTDGIGPQILLRAHFSRNIDGIGRRRTLNTLKDYFFQKHRRHRAAYDLTYA